MRVTVAARARAGLAPLAGGATACIALCAVLGYAATHGFTVGLDDAAARALFGRFPAVAHVFTTTGYAPFLVAATLAAVIAVRLARGPWWLGLAIVASQLVSQGVVELVKHVFMRARPLQWMPPHELGLSYPSGHATTALVFYGCWLVVAARSALPAPLRATAIALLLVWMLGLDFARIALGAHFASDVIGGNLFGGGWLLAALAIFRATPFGSTHDRSLVR